MRRGLADAAIEDQGFTVIWAAPILPGKAEAWRRFMQELMGERRPDYEDTCRRLDVQAMRGWITETARGDIGVIAVIASRPEQVLVGLSESERPFERWFRFQLATLQGVDINRPPRMPPTDLVLDWRSPTENRGEGGNSGL